MKRHVNKSFLDGYLRYTEKQESPELFHLWVGMSLISTVLDRKVYIDHGYFKIYPNMFVVLVAGSQKCRKSTAIDMGLEVLKDLKKHPTLISQKVTPQALISRLAKEASEKKVQEGKAKASGFIVADEISTYLDRNSIQQGMFPVMLKLHDCQDRFSYETKKRGEEVLHNTYINMLAGSSPEYLRKSFPSDESGGGMLARTVLVYQDQPKGPRPMLSMTDKMLDLRRRLVHDLSVIQKLEGTMRFTDDAIQWYENWYSNIWYEDREGSYPEVLKHYVNKKPDHLQKVATIISISRSNRLVINVDHLKSALGLLEQTEKYMHIPLSTIIAEGSGVVTQTVLDAIAIIHSYGQRPTFQSILRKVHKTISYEEMREGLETLVQAGIVIREKAPNGEVYFVPDENREGDKWE